jgi:hypothetical protein
MESYRHPGPRRQRRRRPAALITLVSLAALFISLLAPIQMLGFAPQAAAADDPVTINITKYDCVSNYGHDYSQLAANCSAPSYQTEFQVYGPNFTQFYTGSFSQDGLTAGVFSIREIIPNGYGEPIAYCTFTDGQGNSSSMELITYDGYLEQQVDAGVTLSCNWYNIPLQQAPTYGNISINKHFCKGPNDFDAYSASIYDLAANCNEPATNVVFATFQNGTKLKEGTSTGAPNLLTFEDLPVGTITIVETIPEGYGDPIVFCSVKDEQGNDRAPATEAPVDNDRIDWNLNSGDVVFCDWFNVPAPLRTTISVVKYNCPDSIGYSYGEYDDYTKGCTQAASGISFKLDSASTGNPGNQETDTNGQITWSDMEADHYFLTEEVPSDYQQPVVFCAYYLPNASPQDQDFESYSISSDNQIEFDMKDGQYIVCVWFNVSKNWKAATATPPPPTATSSAPPPGKTATATAVPKKPTLIIHLHLCEAEYDSFAQDADPKKDCTDLADQASFKLAPLTGTGNGTTNPVDNTGKVTFANVEVGSYRLSEVSFPVDASAFIQTCTSTGRDLSTYPFQPFAVVDADGSVALSLINGETLECDWYDVPSLTGGNGLTIQVYECGSGQTSITTVQCEKATSPVLLVLAPVDQGSPQIVQTNDSGFAHVDGLDGNFTLSETGEQPCRVDSDDLGADGTLSLSPDRATSVSVFNCD